MKMLFEDLYIFSPAEKRARKISFKEGVNIITSSKMDGTNRGKSVIMRSLYHALGAESRFEDKFAAKNKVFILHFHVDAQPYYIYRAANLFKVFDGQKKLLFSVVKASALAKALQEIIHFSVMLPNKQTNKLEVTPPAYNYLPYFLEQDKYEGSRFESFKNLEQYANYKDYVLFYHFGVYTQNYFTLVRQREELESLISEQDNRIEVLREVIKDIGKKLEATAYSKDVDALQRDVIQYRQQYSKIVGELNKSRKCLVDARNLLFEYETTLKGVAEVEKINDRGLDKLQSNTCPECGSLLNDTLVLKSKRYNLAEDIITVRNDMQGLVCKLQETILKEENHYRELLVSLNEYEKSLRINTAEINDVLKYKGMCELRDDVMAEYSSIQQSKDKTNDELVKIKKAIKERNKEKKSIDDRYYKYLMEAKMRFGLDEIPEEKLKSVTTNFEASGSDKCIATVIWYLTIIKLRNEFNPNAIQFPIIFDSPNNVENDDEKTDVLIKYLLENAGLSPQFIISGIGLDTDDFRKTVGDANVVTLTTPKFQLLQKNEFIQYESLLSEFCAAEFNENMDGDICFNLHSDEEKKGTSK